MKKFLIHIAALGALTLAQPAAAQYQLNVREADIRAFVQDAARVTGKTFIVDGRVQGKVSVVTDRPLSRSEYFEVFLSTLRANGLVAIPMRGGGYRIQLADGAATQPTQVGSKNTTASQFVTEVFRLRSIDATAAVETLRPLVSREGSITANRNANSLVVADYADNIRRMRDLIRQIDRDSAATQVVPLKNAGAREIATSLQTLAGQGGGEGAAAPVTIVAFDSSNSVALRGDPTSVSRFAAMARDLDNRAESGAEIRVYNLQHADAATLLPTIQALIGGQESASSDANSRQIITPVSTAPTTQASGSNGQAGQTSAAPVTSGPVAVSSNGGGGIAKRGPVIVTRYEGVNALIIAANPDVQRQLGELIRQIDDRPAQVVIEAIVVEIGDDAAKRLGVQFLFAGENAPFVSTSYSNAQPNILTIAGALGAEELNRQTTTVNGTTTVTTTSSALGTSLQEAAAASILGVTGGLGGFAVQSGSNIFGAIINAVQSDTNSNLLATPHITTLNNKQAKFLFGQEIPVSTGEALSNNFDNAFRTVQRQEVGIKLEVTPQVNDNGEVTMYINQEVSSVAGPVSSRSSDLIVNKRQFQTTMVAQDGEIMAIGGLLNDDERRTIEKIPFLGDLPVIGNLFKSKSRSRSKTNLVVFIRPTVLRTNADGQAVTARRYNYARSMQLLRNPDQEPSLDQLVRDYMGTVPPVGAVVGPNDALIGASDRLPSPPPASPIIPVDVPPSGGDE
ncbi:type II secretion system secretin GspD [Sphingorhabdus arenilitoris]|uniref:Type II secretion system secretin GspD n=1 Tax=Sphingorhabdus arenilitoris TaxID=1490041 RepID=A0ABV8RHB1_9SPHN